MDRNEIDALCAELDALLAKATPGEWEVDSEYDEDALYSGGGGCGSGFKNFFIGTDIGGKWRTLLDTQNSDHKLIEEDYDEDGKNAWDSIGQANAALIAALRNKAPAMLTALRQLQAENARLHENAKANNDLARMYKKQADEFRAKYVAAVGSSNHD
jgi:hypothetical protein